MKKLTVAVFTAAGLLMSAPALAQAQGSNQAADYALSWGAVSGNYGGYGRAYARAGSERYAHRRHWR